VTQRTGHLIYYTCIYGPHFVDELDAVKRDSDGKLLCPVHLKPLVKRTGLIGTGVSKLTEPQKGRMISQIAFTWNVDGTVATMVYYDGNMPIFTLTFTYVAGNVTNIVRS
jgi:hypothetical protein